MGFPNPRVHTRLCEDGFHPASQRLGCDASVWFLVRHEESLAITTNTSDLGVIVRQGEHRTQLGVVLEAGNLEVAADTFLS